MPHTFTHIPLIKANINTHTHVRTHTHRLAHTRICKSMLMNTYTHKHKLAHTHNACTHTRTQARMYTQMHTHTCMHAHTHAGTHVHTNAHTYVHARTHARRHACTHKCTHTHTCVFGMHTQSSHNSIIQWKQATNQSQGPALWGSENVTQNAEPQRAGLPSVSGGSESVTQNTEPQRDVFLRVSGGMNLKMRLKEHKGHKRPSRLHSNSSSNSQRWMGHSL